MRAVFHRLAVAVGLVLAMATAPEASTLAGIATDPAISFLASRASTGNSFAEPGIYGQNEPGMFGPTMRIAAPAAVPEPASLMLLGTGLATLAARRRRTQPSERLL
jgi:hypothetical protein